MAIDGIDVFEGAGTIAWDKVADDGKKFVFIRGAYGDRPDKMVQQNFAAAKAKGLFCGIYHFLRASRDYTQQLKTMSRVLDQIRLGAGDLPPAIDVEDNPKFDGPWSAANNSSYIDALRTWLSTMQSRFNCAPIVYASAGFWETLGNPAGFNDKPLWVANYGSAHPKLPEGWTDYKFWQFSESGSVDGVAGNCDLDVFKGSIADLQKLLIS
jgi:lysozyme